MSKAIENLQAAQHRAMATRPKAGGFPYLAETLRRAGVTRNLWFLPACESLFLTEAGSVIKQRAPLLSGAADVPPFDREALIVALRTDQAGNCTFPEFLAASWRAGVVRYDVDFAARTVAYYGCNGEEYAESYPPCNCRWAAAGVTDGILRTKEHQGPQRRWRRNTRNHSGDRLERTAKAARQGFVAGL